MENTENLDHLINEYSSELLKIYTKRKPKLKEEAMPVFATTTATEKITEVKTEQTPPTARETTTTITDDSLSDTATFFASVRSGEGAFPIPNAKVIVGKGREILSFLVTDENGNTETVTLPAYPEKDSLSSETAREVEYYADVYAEGFQEKRRLPVSASGGAEILLNVELTPNEERTE